jgi:lipopolysaccharide transport system ATP-binding protein
VGSLLEVGTGFHPELTGRENIYLNGSIIGMRKREIDRKFDEIVAFAEVDQFLDTPVKFYSSGMYMRLAFSVAAHLEPEILIVDEALAVGDAGFQKKCLGKMGNVSKEGRTVVLVSHNIPAVRSICKRGIVLENGQELFNGPIEDCISKYTATFDQQVLLPSNSFSQPFSVSPWITSATILSSGTPTATLRMGDKFSLVVGFRSISPIQQPGLGIVISTQEGQPILCASNRFQSSDAYETRVTGGNIYCDFGAVPFMENRYIVSLYLGDSLRDSHFIENALTFVVREYDCWGQGKVPPRKAAHLWWPTTFSFQ